MLVTGRRVLLHDGTAVLAVDENLRYGPMKAGYHGGASPAEVVVPVTVLVPGAVPEDGGLRLAPPQEPSWWIDPVLPASRVKPGHRRQARPRPAAARRRPQARHRAAEAADEAMLTLFDEPEPTTGVAHRRPQQASTASPGAGGGHGDGARVAGLHGAEEGSPGGCRSPMPRSARCSMRCWPRAEPPAGSGGGRDRPEVSPVAAARGGHARPAAAERRGATPSPRRRRRRDPDPGRRAAAGAVRYQVVTAQPSPRRRREVIDALRRGTVPANGLDLLAVGLERFTPALDAELDAVAGGGSAFKAIRGEYGSGKTFLTRYVAERALRPRFRHRRGADIGDRDAAAQAGDRLPADRGVAADRGVPAERVPAGAGLLAVHPRVRRASPPTRNWPSAAQTRSTTPWSGSWRQRLAAVSVRTPAFAQALRAYRAAVLAGDAATADALAAWLGGQPHVAASAKRSAGIRGELDHFGAMGFLQGLLEVLRDAGHPGLLLVLDEVETLQRVRGDVRDKALNALRQLLDEIDSGRYPGLFLMITGTAAFYDGPSGVTRLPPLAQRLATDFSTDSRFDNPRAVQLRLPGFDRDPCWLSAARSATCTRRAPRRRTGSRRLVDDGYIADAGRRRHRGARRQGRHRAPRVPEEARRRCPGPGRPVR